MIDHLITVKHVTSGHQLSVEITEWDEAKSTPGTESRPTRVQD